MAYDEDINYWLNAAAHDLDVAETLFEKSKYDWCLFIAHLVLEKTLKAFYVRDNRKMPPPIHKLDILALKGLEYPLIQKSEILNTDQGIDSLLKILFNGITK